MPYSANTRIDENNIEDIEDFLISRGIPCDREPTRADMVWVHDGARWEPCGTVAGIEATVGF